MRHLLDVGGQDPASWPKRVVRHMFAGAAANTVNWTGQVCHTAKNAPVRYKLADSPLGGVILGES